MAVLGINQQKEYYYGLFRTRTVSRQWMEWTPQPEAGKTCPRWP